VGCVDFGYFFVFDFGVDVDELGLVEGFDEG